MQNPIRSEADAFRLVVIIGVGAAAVIALTLLTRPALGVALASLLIGIGIGRTWRPSRGAPPHRARIAPRRLGAYGILVVVAETVGGEALLGEIAIRCRGRRAEVLVVAPVLTADQLDLRAAEGDAGGAVAERRLGDSVGAIEAIGVAVTGRVGDEDPIVAIEDALATFAVDEVVIATHPPARSSWLERGVIERARAELDLPITHVVVDPGDVAGAGR
jgi:GABA permease